MCSTYQTPLTTLPLGVLLDARHHARRHSGSRRSGLDQFPGQRTGPKRGQGLEFEDLRQYSAGDDIRHIDWNVTARTGEPYTRLYREEHEHTTTVILDFRPSMFTGAHILKSVRAGQLAAAVLWQASFAGDRCAAVTYSDNGIFASRPMSGHRGVITACELIAREFETARHDIDKPERHLAHLLEWINSPGRNLGTHLLFSGFDSAGQEAWITALQIAGLMNHLVGVMLLDTLEVNGVPSGHYIYRNREGSAAITIDEQTRLELSTIVHEEIVRLHHDFSTCNVPLVNLNPETDSERLVAYLLDRAVL